MTLRLLVLIALLLATSPIVRGTEPSARLLPVPLAMFPRGIAGWTGVDSAPLDPDVARVLGADDHLHRIYRHVNAGIVSVWVAFYGAQHQGDAIHSPMNCLPGAGWTPVAHSRPMLRMGDREFQVNRYVVQKRGERQVVTYWYQGRGRIVASEYANKAYLLLDALRLRRTDGAIVRLTAPVAAAAETRADHAVAAFAAQFQPQLARWIR